ncbi:hypothetical protein HUJ05_005411 [Dendroctonus ponderosae]|nr:hypothetical protein HUJ05_005411 [Dendroctonus ponderosae]
MRQSPAILIVAYRRWICSELVPFFGSGGGRISPCLHLCQDVEQQCPYLLPDQTLTPSEAAHPTPQYAGEPAFLCLGSLLANQLSQHTTVGAEVELDNGRRRLLLYSLWSARPGGEGELRLRPLPRQASERLPSSERLQRGALVRHKNYHQPSVPVDVVDLFVMDAACRRATF